jgi:hypothetical protein
MDMSTISKQTLKKRHVKAWSGLSLLRIGSMVDFCVHCHQLSGYLNVGIFLSHA